MPFRVTGMANVLPLDAQKRVWRLYRARFMVALSILIFALAVILGLSLIPSYLALSLATSPTRDVPETARAQPADAAAIARAQALIGQFSPSLTSTSSPTALLRKAIEARPAGLTLNHLSYQAGQQSATGEIILVGHAPREKIAAYRNALTSAKTFSSVSLPVAALVGSDNGRFSITLRGDF